MHVVVVESPSKAKTINKYLGGDYRVLASYGHVRDLPAKDGSVSPERDFEMIYEVDPKSARQLADIAKALKGADKLILATDPDREGEAISWHVLEALQNKKALAKGVSVERVTFNEITKSAVREAMAHPRAIDIAMVNAQQARRALDYLVGFTLSPILWRKLPGARSAGRVQSVALRLVCEREIEIEAFKPQEYWSIEVDVQAANGRFTARLVQADGRKLDRLDIGTRDEAMALAERLRKTGLKIADVQTKPVRRNPPPPFTTSTLQQEASRKLGFGAKRTMQVAQGLYEGVDIGGETVGLITYMRTDGVSMADEAVANARAAIKGNFGADYVPDQPRAYKSKVKNAQEAHEAIRPTDFDRSPDRVARYLNDEQRKLYDLVWKRALASQMESAALERTTIDIAGENGALGLRATGSVVTFPGFLKLYEEGMDDRAAGDDEDGARLPKVTSGEALKHDTVKPEQHFTEPPPRFTEASLVKKLEELGIGRPSTYASILSVLQERSYVKLEKNRFIPEDKGRLVTAFLTEFFEHYFAYDFTANLEERLDDISAQTIDWKAVLRDFWLPFSMLQGLNPQPKDQIISVKEAIATLDEVIGKRSVVIDRIDAVLGPHFFPVEREGHDPRVCPACKDGRLGIKLGRTGAFIGCSRYPECRYTRPLAIGGDGADDGAALANGPKPIGEDPNGTPVTLRMGPFGPYVQLGEAEEDGPKPRRSSVPKGTPMESVDIEMALALLALPRVVGIHPESGEEITANNGRFGPYVKHGGTYANLTKDESPLTVGLNRAVVLIAEKEARGAARRGGELIRAMGPHPDDKQPVEILKGRYGPYLRHGKTNANVQEPLTPETITIDEAVALLAARPGGKAKKKVVAKKKAAAPKKPAAKKSAAKKAAAPKAKTAAKKKVAAKKKAAGGA